MERLSKILLWVGSVPFGIAVFTGLGMYIEKYPREALFTVFLSALILLVSVVLETKAGWARREAWRDELDAKTDAWQAEMREMRDA